MNSYAKNKLALSNSSLHLCRTISFSHRYSFKRSRIDRVWVTCQYNEVAVQIERPLGLTLETFESGRGALVSEISPDSNAFRSGKFEVGDIFTQICGADETVLLDCVEDKLFDDILSALQSPSVSIFTIRLRRVVPLSLESLDSSNYWETQRLKKAQKGAQILRRTVGVEPKDIRIDINGKLGEGNFGIVFGGRWKNENIILKTSKINILGAELLLDNELLINEAVHREAKGSCARFLGCCEIGEFDGGEIYNGTLSKGLWLLWAREGENTLGEALRSSPTLSSSQYMETYLEDEMDDILVFRKIIKDMGMCLLALHSAGIVHRDIKPDNILITHQGLKFIDLGSAAKCLSEPINYFPGEGPADPRYCKDDELHLLPKEAPKPNQSNLEKLWEENLPDRFDIYSTGITLIQVLLPALRNDYELAIFKNELRECEYDLLRWRRVKCSFPEAYLKPLDENAGCGWDFLGKLLAEKRKDRITAQEMLAHEFLNF